MAAQNGHVLTETEVQNGVFINVNLALDDSEKRLDVQEQNETKDFLGVPRSGHRMSIMEEESARERIRMSLLKQCSAILKQGDQKYTKESLHKTFQDEDLLERIFKLFDIEKVGCLTQKDWIEYLKERLPEERQIEFVEQVESLAYVLCGDGEVSLDHFQRIFKSKVVTDKLFRILDNEGANFVTAEAIMEILATVSSSRPRAGFNRASVDRLESLFRETCGDQKEITREQFQKIVVSKNPFFTERVFQIFDTDHSGSISLSEFLSAAHHFLGTSPDDKIRFLFKVYDLDGDGLIQHRELQHVMRACMHENGMHFSEQQLAELTAAMFEDADEEQRGAITYEALKRQLRKHDGLLENLTISIDRWLIPPKPEEESLTLVQRLLKHKPHQLSKQYVKNNFVYVGYLAVFFAVNIALFVTRAYQYRESNGFVIMARACGQCLNFNCMWVLVLMLRRCITWARSHQLCAVLPLDHHIYLHKLTGILIIVYSAVHTVMHLCNFGLIVIHDPILNSHNYTLPQWLFTWTPGQFGVVGGVANPTGVVLVAALGCMAICSRPAVRRGGSFEIFYWTHLLYIPFWLLLLFHGPNFWKWFIIPGTVYVAERITRLAWMRSGRGRSYISVGILLPSRVTHVVVKRPPSFHFHAGDYVFVNIPEIAAFEWHPFTISSAPEQEDYIWLHIRGVGQWTNRVYEYFEKQQQRLHAGAVHPHTDLRLTHDKVGRTTSSQSGKSKKSVDFSPVTYTNAAFNMQDEDTKNEESVESPPLVNSPAETKGILSLPYKMPLEKSHSMPDMQVKNKKKERLNALHAYTRSESEYHIERPKPVNPSLGLAYKSPQNKGLAESFRYMRNKPTIIAFKTPSMDNCERDNLLTVARRRLSKSISPDKPKDVESCDNNKNEENTDEEFANYPVGKPLEIYLDGPHGAPSSHIFSASHAALIAAGIGVTPFASILQSVARRHRRRRLRCPRCHHDYAGDVDTSDCSLNKVDFFWINREQRSFEWFVSLLSRLEMEQAELGGDQDFLQLHLYITSAVQRHDMRAVGLTLALDLMHDKGKRDLITGLKTRTNAGRPNWDKVFKQLQQQNKGKVTVFYCGPPPLAKILRIKCDEFGFEFRKEVF